MALWAELIAVAALAGRSCVGLIFFVAAVQKMGHWRLLSGVITNYRLLPDWLVAPAAALLPPVEMLLAIALLSGQFQPWPALIAIVLLVVFAAAMAINLARGRTHVDCGCGQDFLAQYLSWPLVARNFVLTALLLPSLMVTAALRPPDLLTAAAAGLGFFLLYLLFNLFSALPATRARRFA